MQHVTSVIRAPPASEWQESTSNWACKSHCHINISTTPYASISMPLHPTGTQTDLPRIFPRLKLLLKI
jgi:hypothetical protein